jgi:hypothetical protein
MYYKYSVRWRQAISVPKIDACGLLDQAYMYGLENIIMVFLNSTSSPLPKCPFEVGQTIVIANYTEKPSKTEFMSMPTGDYKTVIKLHTDDDDLALRVAVQYLVTPS